MTSIGVYPIETCIRAHQCTYENIHSSTTWSASELETIQMSISHTTDKPSCNRRLQCNKHEWMTTAQISVLHATCKHTPKRTYFISHVCKSGQWLPWSMVARGGIKGLWGAGDVSSQSGCWSHSSCVKNVHIVLYDVVTLLYVCMLYSVIYLRHR